MFKSSPTSPWYYRNLTARRLEQALRHFSCLTQGDIIEIIYNSIVFGFLIMETSPGGEGIDVLDTDLEVDFAAPKGYVEPERPKVAPPATMASKLKIDLNEQTPGSSRPSSSQSGTFVGPSRTGGTTLSKDGDTWESFKGKGQTLEGRKTKGRGISHRKVEEVATDSRIIRTEFVIPIYHFHGNIYFLSRQQTPNRHEQLIRKRQSSTRSSQPSIWKAVLWLPIRGICFT